jgi:hypothetical protein
MSVATRNSLPVYVISFNNATYVKLMVQQLLRKGVLVEEIHVLDNATTHPPCVEILKEVEAMGVEVKRFNKNHGHQVAHQYATEQRFVVTDPDLLFSEALPMNFIDTLVQIADHTGSKRVGLALDISTEANQLLSTKSYFQSRSITEWESQFWETRVRVDTFPDLEMYSADIDTTFHVCTRDAPNYPIRVAGDFTAKHLPWYDPPLIEVPAQKTGGVSMQWFNGFKHN